MPLVGMPANGRALSRAAESLPLYPKVYPLGQRLYESGVPLAGASPLLQVVIADAVRSYSVRCPDAARPPTVEPARNAAGRNLG